MKGCRPLPIRNRPAHLQLSGTYALSAGPGSPSPQDGFRIAELLSLQVGDVWQHGQVVQQLTVRSRAYEAEREGRTVPPPRGEGGSRRPAAGPCGRSRTSPPGRMCSAVARDDRPSRPPSLAHTSAKLQPPRINRILMRKTLPIRCTTSWGLTSFARSALGHQQSATPNATELRRGEIHAANPPSDPQEMLI